MVVPVFFAPCKKKASDGNRRHVLTSETTKRKRYNAAKAYVNKVYTKYSWWFRYWNIN
jgi:ribosomal protein L35